MAARPENGPFCAEIKSAEACRKGVVRLSEVPVFGGSTSRGSVFFAKLKPVRKVFQRVRHLLLFGQNNG